MNHIATVALMLTLSVAGVYAQPMPVRMTFSGTGGPSAINLQHPNTNTAEENVSGSGTLGLFTFRNVRTIATSPQPSSTCSGPTKLFFPSMAGAGILRFLDGSLLKVNLVQGGDCIDFAVMQGHCTLTLQVAGGTGRFQGASGVLNFTETAVPVLADAHGNPTLFAETGELTGTVSGVARWWEAQDER